MKAIYIHGQDKKSKIEEKRLLKYINKKKKECDCIVVGKKLKSNTKFIDNINDIGIPISDGRWLFKFLVIQILEYISKCQNIDINKLKVALVTNENSDLISYYIDELTKKSNKIKIITNNREKFYSIEKKLYYDNGIVLEVSSNKRKGLQDIDIIINFDFDEENLNRYKIKENTIIVNLREQIGIYLKRFSGINISFYEINFKNRIIEMLDWTKEFDKVDLYESYIYRRDKIENIEKDILKDKVAITGLVGGRGKISEKEYKNVLDKTYYLS